MASKIEHKTQDVSDPNNPRKSPSSNESGIYSNSKEYSLSTSSSFMKNHQAGDNQLDDAVYEHSNNDSQSYSGQSDNRHDESYQCPKNCFQTGVEATKKASSKKAGNSSSTQDKSDGKKTTACSTQNTPSSLPKKSTSPIHDDEIKTEDRDNFQLNKIDSGCDNRLAVGALAPNKAHVKLDAKSTSKSKQILSSNNSLTAGVISQEVSSSKIRSLINNDKQPTSIHSNNNNNNYNNNTAKPDKPKKPIIPVKPDKLLGFLSGHKSSQKKVDNGLPGKQTLKSAQMAKSEQPIEKGTVTLQSDINTGVRNLKSLLKRSKHRDVKHTKKVSFNQTVIVFCEEIETSIEDEGDIAIDSSTEFIDDIFDNPYEFSNDCIMPNTDLMPNRIVHDGNEIFKINNENLLELFNEKHANRPKKNRNNFDPTKELRPKHVQNSPELNRSSSMVDPLLQSKDIPEVDILKTPLGSYQKQEVMKSARVKSSIIDFNSIKRNLKVSSQSKMNSVKLPNELDATNNQASNVLISNACDRQEFVQEVCIGIQSHNNQSQPISRSQFQQNYNDKLDNAIGEIYESNQPVQHKCYICSAMENGLNHPSLPNYPEINSSSLTRNFDNSSCKSCQEDSKKIQNEQSNLLPCEIVNVVDQFGNSIKALSVLYPQTPNNPLAGKRILIANESLISRILSSSQTSGQPMPPGGLKIMLPPSLIQRLNAVTAQTSQPPTKPIHTVYYVQQPLENRQGNDTNKAFPDPHEVRRLDGLRNLPQSQIHAHGPIGDVYGRVGQNMSSENDVDDPTFGFSSRPSVKGLVASVSGRPAMNISHFPHQHSHFCEGTQTLARRMVQREFIPGPSQSMTNIQSVLKSRDQFPVEDNPKMLPLKLTVSNLSQAAIEEHKKAWNMAKQRAVSENVQPMNIGSYGRNVSSMGFSTTN